MTRQIIVAVGLVAFLAACAGSASGPKFTEVQLPPPTSGAAQLVVYRTGKWGLSNRASDLVVNGTPTCETLNNGAFTYEVQPGPVKLELALWDMPGTSFLTLDAAPDNRYYIRIESNDGKVFPAAFAGFLGLLIAEAVSPNRGPFEMRLVDRGEADRDLADARLAPCNRSPQPVAVDKSEVASAPK